MDSPINNSDTMMTTNYSSTTSRTTSSTADNSTNIDTVYRMTNSGLTMNNSNYIVNTGNTSSRFVYFKVTYKKQTRLFSVETNENNSNTATSTSNHAIKPSSSLNLYAELCRRTLNSFYISSESTPNSNDKSRSTFLTTNNNDKNTSSLFPKHNKPTFIWKQSSSSSFHFKATDNPSNSKSITSPQENEDDKIMIDSDESMSTLFHFLNDLKLINNPQTESDASCVHDATPQQKWIELELISYQLNHESNEINKVENLGKADNSNANIEDDDFQLLEIHGNGNNSDQHLSKRLSNVSSHFTDDGFSIVDEDLVFRNEDHNDLVMEPIVSHHSQMNEFRKQLISNNDEDDQMLQSQENYNLEQLQQSSYEQSEVTDDLNVLENNHDNYVSQETNSIMVNELKYVNDEDEVDCCQAEEIKGLLESDETCLISQRNHQLDEVNYESEEDEDKQMDDINTNELTPLMPGTFPVEFIDFNQQQEEGMVAQGPPDDYLYADTFERVNEPSASSSFVNGINERTNNEQHQRQQQQDNSEGEQQPHNQNQPEWSELMKEFGNLFAKLVAKVKTDEQLRQQMYFVGNQIKSGVTIAFDTIAQLMDQFFQNQNNHRFYSESSSSDNSHFHGQTSGKKDTTENRNDEREPLINTLLQTSHHQSSVHNSSSFRATSTVVPEQIIQQVMQQVNQIRMNINNSFLSSNSPAITKINNTDISSVISSSSHTRPTFNQTHQRDPQQEYQRHRCHHDTSSTWSFHRNFKQAANQMTNSLSMNELEQLNTLESMGFMDRDMNKQLLRRFNGKLDKVIEHYLG